jgi:hypothetical protein
MVTVTVEVSEKFIKRKVRCTAPSIERAVEIARGSRPASAKVLFPIDPDLFFADGCGISNGAAPFESQSRERVGS